jgi:hypothetical protein
MKKLLLLTSLVLLCMSCSNDDDQNNNTVQNQPDLSKKLTILEYVVNSGGSSWETNFIDNQNDQLIKTKNENNDILNKYTYDTNGKVSQIDWKHYEHNTLFSSGNRILTYDNNDRIISIEGLRNQHHYDGSITNQRSETRNVLYTVNTISVNIDATNELIKLFEVDSNNKITYMKLYDSNGLEVDMNYVYNSDGNVTSINGQLRGGASVNFAFSPLAADYTYNNIEKHLFFNREFMSDLILHNGFINAHNRILYRNGKYFVERANHTNTSINAVLLQIYQHSFDNDFNLISTDKINGDDLSITPLTQKYTWQ